MMKSMIATLSLVLVSTTVFASSALQISQSTSSEEVEMELTADKQIIKNAQPDAALYIVNNGKAEFLTPALLKAMETVQYEKQSKKASGFELAVEILKVK